MISRVISRIHLCQCTTTIDVMLYRTAVELNSDPTGDNTCPTTAIDTAFDGTLGNGNGGIGNRSIVIAQSQFTTGSTIDITIVVITIDTDRTFCIDDNRGIAFHLTHSTCTIDIIGYTAAKYLYRGIALYDTSLGIVESSFTVMCFVRRICIVLIRTATAAIDVTAISIKFCWVTNSSTPHRHRCIMECVSILTTTIERAVDSGAGSLVILCTNHYLRAIHPSHIVLNGTMCCDITS